MGLRRREWFILNISGAFLTEIAWWISPHTVKLLLHKVLFSWLALTSVSTFCLRMDPLWIRCLVFQAKSLCTITSNHVWSTIHYIITAGVGGSFTIPVDEKTFNTVKNDLITFQSRDRKLYSMLSNWRLIINRCWRANKIHPNLNEGWWVLTNLI
jgi:hypothetical protein